MQQRTIEILSLIAVAVGSVGAIGGLGWNMITYLEEQYEPEIQIKEKADIKLQASNSTESHVGYRLQNGTLLIFQEELYSTEAVHSFVIVSSHNMIVTIRESEFVQNLFSAVTPEDLQQYVKVDLDIYRTSPVLVKEGGDEVKIEVPIRARIPVASAMHGWAIERHIAPTLLGEFIVIIEFRDVQSGEIKNERVVSDVLYSGAA